MLVLRHQWSQHPLAKKIRKTFRVITLSQENRDRIADEISMEMKKL
jgi:nucleoside-triphosphatase THEP1